LLIKSYCTQNNGDCSTCSLVSYNRDCQGNAVHGGCRPGAGRKASGRKAVNFYITDEEKAKLKEYLDSIRDRGSV
jgi:hypothetical protein